MTPCHYSKVVISLTPYISLCPSDENLYLFKSVVQVVCPNSSHGLIQTAYPEVVQCISNPNYYLVHAQHNTFVISMLTVVFRCALL